MIMNCTVCTKKIKKIVQNKQNLFGLFINVEKINKF